jgi:transposase
LEKRKRLIPFYLLEFEQNVRGTIFRYTLDIQSGEKTKGDFSLFGFQKLYMKRLLKQVVGIDVAQKELVVSVGRMHDDLIPELYGHHTFANTAKGFEALVTWVTKRSDASTAVQYVLEATGVYHEKLAYFLHEKGQGINVILPNRISSYQRTLDIKTVTDKTASEAIARFGLERKLQNWEKPKPIFKKLQQITRERDQLIQTRTLIKNQLHAEQAEAEPNAGSIKRLKQQVALLNKQEKEIQAEILSLLDSDQPVKEAVKKLCSLPGVGVLTAVVVLAETNGFELIRNKRQLASYAGFDVKEKQSGTSVKGKPRISKRGNRHLRKAMHFPALGAIRRDDRFKAIFARLVSKHSIKMKAVVAVQRRLLEMIYVLYKTGTTYDENYLQHRPLAESESVENEPIT